MMARMRWAATFGWLCVETLSAVAKKLEEIAATFGWLCVETTVAHQFLFGANCAATFGWLCVETTALTAYSKMCQQPPSGGCVLKLLNHRKQVKSDGAATFGWLCVETLLVLI